MDEDDENGAENSVQPPDLPFIYLSDESDEVRDGGPTIGRKRNIRTVYYSSGGEEVQQCSSSRLSVDANVGHPPHLSQDAVEVPMSDMNLTPNSSSTEYRQSSDSDHVRPNLSDEGSYDAEDYEPIQQVTRDFSNSRLRQCMKFTDSATFKEFVASYCLYIGADILWLKSCKSKMEAICREHCGWRVYGSWNSRKEAFVLKCLGENHRCPRALENKQASAKWIVKMKRKKKETAEGGGGRSMAARVAMEERKGGTKRSLPEVLQWFEDGQQWRKEEDD
ncbi:hypothetical protein LINPERHAP2_LOCUS8952, partial [Linum perenne]